jgi:hypothetical protein
VTLADLFAECEERTGEAHAVWRSQGLEPPGVSGPLAFLQLRSVRLLSEVVEGVADEPASNAVDAMGRGSARFEPEAGEPPLPSR